MLKQFLQPKPLEPDEPGQLEFTADAEHHSHHHGDFRIHVAKNPTTGKEHVVLIKGEVVGQPNVLVRIASECVPGIVFHSADCECKEQLDIAMDKITAAGQGMLIYLRQEGRGQGLTTKILALRNKNQGHDTFTAVELLGEKPDVRTYEEAVEILQHFQVNSVRLLTNNPDKVTELESAGITVTGTESVEVPATENTKIHLQAKKARGHTLSHV